MVLLVAPQSIQDMSISVCLRVFQCLEHGTRKVGGGSGPGSTVFFAGGLG